MLSLNKFLGDGIPFSEYLKSMSKKKKKSNKSKKMSKRTKRLKKQKRQKSKRTKRKKRQKRQKSKKKQHRNVPPSGVIIRKNDQLFKSDGKNLQLIE